MIHTVSRLHVEHGRDIIAIDYVLLYWHVAGTGPAYPLGTPLQLITIGVQRFSQTIRDALYQEYSTRKNIEFLLVFTKALRLS
jgi:hypothetical protein